MIVKLYVNHQCEIETLNGSKLTDSEKKKIYAEIANKGLTEEQMKDPDVCWRADEIDTEVFERVFLRPNSHILVDLPYELINPDNLP